MSLPFTHEQFLDVFVAYNSALWPFVVLMWLLTLGAVAQLYRRGVAASRLLTAVLALHWAWSALAYHLAFFRSVNPAATLFAGAFLVHAALLLWRGVARPDVSFTPSGTFWGTAGAGLIAYSLVYPALGVLFGLTYPRLPTFGVPCPTTIFTAGTLLLLPRRQARPLAVIPVLWAGVGGSAAYLLDIRADYALIMAGVLLLIYVLLPADGEAA